MRTRTYKDDAGLLLRVARGEAQAVDELLRRYRPLVWSIVSERVPHHVAEDVVQEVFIQLWKNAPRFDPSLSSEAGFVGMIARRRLVDRHRRESVRGPDLELPEDLSLESAELASLEAQDEYQRAERALESIRPEEQLVLRMSLSGLSHAEIARRTDTPLGTVKSHARRGLERVRRLMDKGSKD
jgi:RNA polymerase sigma-70 factor (ECF subfamily)